MTWTDPTSVTARLTQLASLVVSVVALVHPGWHEPEAVQTAVPAVGLVVASAVQLVESWRHTTITKAALGHDAAVKALAAPPK